MSIRIHIARLTVEGSSRADAARAGDSLRMHLTKLVSRGISPAAGNTEKIEAGEIRADAGMDRAGRHAAERIVRYLNAAKGARHV